MQDRESSVCIRGQPWGTHPVHLLSSLSLTCLHCSFQTCHQFYNPSRPFWSQGVDLCAHWSLLIILFGFHVEQFELYKIKSECIQTSLWSHSMLLLVTQLNLWNAICSDDGAAAVSQYDAFLQLHIYGNQSSSFSSVFTTVLLLVSWSIIRISQKLLNRFLPNLDSGWVLVQNRPH